MKSFRFPLDRVLEWRSLQLRTAEEKLARLQQQLNELQRCAAELQATGERVGGELLASESMQGADLRALAAFQLKIKRDAVRMAHRIHDCEQAVQRQRSELIERRRDHRVLEKLKERRKDEWIYLAEQELESMASDAFLAKWNRS